MNANLIGTRLVFPAARTVASEHFSCEPPSAGEIAIQVSHSMLSNGTEAVCYSGDVEPGSHWDHWIRYPFRPGYSCVGTVVAVGPEVEGVEIGERRVFKGGHASLHVIKLSKTWLVPDSVSDAQALQFALSAIAQQAVHVAGDLFHASVAVLGAGPLGRLVAEWALIAGARELLSVSRRGSAAGVIRSSVRTAHLQGDVGEKADQSVADWFSASAADVVFDVTPSTAALQFAGGIVRPAGAIVVVGDTPFPSQKTLGAAFLPNQLIARGVHEMHIPTTGGPRERWTYEAFVRAHLERCGAGWLADIAVQEASFEDSGGVYDGLLRHDHAYSPVMFDWEGARS